MDRRNISWVAVAVLFSLLGCADKEVRLWIEPPAGFRAETQRNLYYRTEDVQSGKKESVAIPINQLPENLVVEAPTPKDLTSSPAAATKADALISGSSKTSPRKEGSPAVSYLRGLRSVEDLYQKKQFEEALIQLAPLLEDYPEKPRLFVMQGTLYRQLGEKKLAYHAYKVAHDLDKSDPKVAEAFYRMQNEAGVEE
jgi:tetratricopeptide (TPR) repeat protein